MRPFTTVQHAVIASATLTGAVGSAVSIEVHVSNGLPGFTIVGLPDAAVRESRDRVRAAILSSGLPWPLRRLTVNLAPSSAQFVGSANSQVNGMSVSPSVRGPAMAERNRGVVDDSVLERFTGSVNDRWNTMSVDEQRSVIIAIVIAVWGDPATKRGFNNFDPDRLRTEWLLDVIEPAYLLRYRASERAPMAARKPDDVDSTIAAE